MKESKEYRSLGHCRFCNEEIFGHNHNKLQAHQRFCKCNPNRLKALKQISDACLKATSKEVHNRAAITKRNNAEKTYKVYTFTCKKCGKQFERKLKIKHFEEGYRIPQYCCNSCANSHIHTVESKLKISKAISKERAHKCPKCGKSFMHVGSGISTTWCDECFEKETGHSREFFISNVKRKYIKGNPRKIGNDIKLHASNCPNCGKLIWSKTSDEVYCYDCVKELHKRLHLLFDENGKLIVKESTRKKLSTLVRKRVTDGTHIGWKVRPIESYPEKFWKQVLTNNGIEFEFNFYIQKKTLGLSDFAGYFLDFKLQNKIDLEIDGKQHKYEDRKQSDLVRDKALSSNGWKIYRIEWNEINTEKGKNLMKQKIDDFLVWYKLNS